MGLDMYAYSAATPDQYEKSWEDNNTNSASRPKELAYWRKHPNLHGWFKREWESLGNQGSFNGDQLELDWAMLDRLEQAVKHKQLPPTQGFFFGQNSDEEYYDSDLEFIRLARAEIFLGLRVFYNSSW